MRPGIGDRGDRRRDHGRDRRPAEIHQRQDEDGEHGHLDFLRLDLLADIFGRAADHQAGHEDRDDDEEEHAVETGADAADDHLAELDVDQRDHAAERGEGIMHGVDRAAGGGRRDDGEERGGDDAEADLLAFHVAAGEAERVHRGGAVGLGPVADDDAGDEQDAHHGEDRPALALIADHAAEDVGQRRPDREDRDHLDEVRQRGRVLEGVRGIGVEEAAAIGAEHLDGDLRGDRPDRDRLLGAFQRRRIDIGAERLRHALPDEEEGVGDADRDEDVEGAAGDIDPEIADRARRAAGEAADERDRQHDARRRRQEVLVGQAEHLRQVGERAFAAVVLPVGVGDEADGGVEGERLRHRAHAGRIERQAALDAEEDVEDQEAGDVEEEHRHRIGQPVLLALLVDPADPVEHGLDRPQDRRQERALAGEDARHVPAERLHQRDHDRAVEDDLNPADDGHVRQPLEALRPQQRKDEISQEAGRHDCGQRIIEDHDRLP